MAAAPHLDGKLLPGVKLQQWHAPEQHSTGKHNAPKENKRHQNEDKPLGITDLFQIAEYGLHTSH
jgi:hypothetical protein